MAAKRDVDLSPWPAWLTWLLKLHWEAFSFMVWLALYMVCLAFNMWLLHADDLCAWLFTDFNLCWELNTRLIFVLLIETIACVVLLKGIIQIWAALQTRYLVLSCIILGNIPLRLILKVLVLCDILSVSLTLELTEIVLPFCSYLCVIFLRKPLELKQLSLVVLDCFAFLDVLLSGK